MVRKYQWFGRFFTIQAGDTLAELPLALAELPLALACGYEKLINIYGFSQIKLK